MGISREEYIREIKEKIGKTVGDNNYKLALAITGHKPGKIKDVVLASAEGEALLDYINGQEQIIGKAREYAEKDMYYCLASGDNITIYINKIIEILDGNVKHE